MWQKTLFRCNQARPCCKRCTTRCTTRRTTCCAGSLLGHWDLHHFIHILHLSSEGFQALVPLGGAHTSDPNQYGQCQWFSLVTMVVV